MQLIQPIPLSQLRREMKTLYVPPHGARATFAKIRQATEELEQYAGAATTADLTPETVARWIQAKFANRAHAGASSLLSALRRVCSYSILRGYLAVSPFAFRSLPDWIRDLEPEEGRANKVRHVPIADLYRIFSRLQTEAASGWKPHRLFALAIATVGTGARAREVQCSRVEDWDLDRKVFTVKSNERRRLKTRPSRRKIPIPPETLAVLTRWLPETSSPWAFPGVTRVGPWQGGPPGYKPIDEIRGAGQAVGVSNLTFLSLRHSYITHSEGCWGVPELLTQRFAGHTRRETTAGYRGWDQANGLAAVASISLGLEPPPA